MNKKSIAVIGSINIDMVVKIPHLPKSGETIISNSFVTEPGGKGANQAYAAAMLGGDVYMVGKTGLDEFADKAMENMIRAGVNTDCVSMEKEAKTGIAFIYVDNEGSNSIVVATGANKLIFKEDIDKHINVINKCDILLLQLEIPVDTVLYAIHSAKAQNQNKIIILNPAPVPNQIPNALFKHIDILIPNEIELQMLTGQETESMNQIEDASKNLISRGVKTVITTLGKRGAVIVDSNGLEYFPSYNVKAVDTTSAGDTFAAAVAVFLSEGMNLSEAVKLANKAASITVSREGSQLSIPSRSELEMSEK